MTKVRWYVLVVVLAAAAGSWVVYAVAPMTDRESVESVLWLSLLGVFALLQVHRLPRGGSGSAVFIPALATGLLSPNWVGIAGVAAANLVGEISSRRSPIKACFNVAQACLAISAAILNYRYLGGISLLDVRDYPFLEASGITITPFIALVATYFAVNGIAVSGVIALSDNRRLLQIWKQNVFGTLAYDVLSGPVVFLFAWAYVKLGPLGAVGLAAPLLGARQLYKTNRQLELVNQELLELMVKAIEARDPYTSGHSRRVAHYSRIIGRAIGLRPAQIERVRTAALLHDVGKMDEVFARILRKPGKLTADEWAIMQTHPIKSAEVVATVSHLADLVSAVRHHHENWDGTGYPDGISAEAIPLESRIIIFADTIDAMTSDRPYRKAMTQGEVRAELIRCRSKQFDPEICDKLLASPLFDQLFSPESRETTPRFSAAPAPNVPRRVAAGA